MYIQVNIHKVSEKPEHVINDAYSSFLFASPKGGERIILSFSLLRERKYGKERGARGIPISPGPLKAAKKTASVFLDLSRVAWKPNANPHYLTNFVCSTDFLQVLKRNCHHI